MIGWGREESIDHPRAFIGETPLGTMRDAIARPSGIFCIAITSTINNPKLQLGQNANPMAMPSTHECTVIIAKKRRSWEAVLPVVGQNVILDSNLSTTLFATKIIPIPMRIPKNTPQTLCLVPSCIRSKLAAIINPAAIDFAMPIPFLEIFFHQKKGSAPMPQAIAVKNE